MMEMHVKEIYNSDECISNKNKEYGFYAVTNKARISTIKWVLIPQDFFSTIRLFS